MGVAVRERERPLLQETRDKVPEASNLRGYQGLLAAPEEALPSASFARAAVPPALSGVESYWNGIISGAEPAKMAQTQEIPVSDRQNIRGEEPSPQKDEVSEPHIDPIILGVTTGLIAAGLYLLRRTRGVSPQEPGNNQGLQEEAPRTEAEPAGQGATRGKREFTRREFLGFSALSAASLLAASCSFDVPVAAEAPQPGVPTATGQRSFEPGATSTATKPATAGAENTVVPPSPTAKATEAVVAPSPTAVATEAAETAPPVEPLPSRTPEASPTARPVDVADSWGTGVPSGTGYEQARQSLSAYLADEGNLEAAGISGRPQFHMVNFDNGTFAIIGRTESGDFYSWNGTTLAPLNAISGKDRKLYFYRWNEVDKQNRPNDNTATGQFSIQDPSVEDGWVKAPDGSIHFNLANEPALARLPVVAVEQPAPSEAPANIPHLVNVTWNSEDGIAGNDYDNTVVEGETEPGHLSGYLASSKDPEVADVQAAYMNARVLGVEITNRGGNQIIRFTLDGGATPNKDNQHFIAAGEFTAEVTNGRVIFYTLQEMPIPGVKGVRAWPVAPSYETEGRTWIDESLARQMNGRLIRIMVGGTMQEALELEAAHMRGEQPTITTERIVLLGAGDPVVQQ